MPRYKDSPEVRAAKQERKDRLREFLSLLEVDDMHDLRSLFKEMAGEVLENGLEVELDDELSYSKYDYRNKNTKNSRNGYSRKTLKTSGGPVEIAVPRDRNGDIDYLHRWSYRLSRCNISRISPNGNTAVRYSSDTLQHEVCVIQGYQGSDG